MNTLQESKENGPIGSKAEVNASNTGAIGLDNGELRSNPVITSPPMPTPLDECKAEIRELKTKVADLEAFKTKMSCFLAETELSASFNDYVLPSPFVHWYQAYDEKYRAIEYKLLTDGKSHTPGLHAADKELLTLYHFVAEYFSDEPVANTVQLLNTLLIGTLSEKEPGANAIAIQNCLKATELSSFLLKLDTHFTYVESEMEPWCKRSIFYSPDPESK